mgnify:CR=1 FL=1
MGTLVTAGKVADGLELAEKQRAGIDADRLQDPWVDHAAGVSFQTTAPDSIIMVEIWESVAHLEAHLQTPHMKAWSEAVKGDVLETHIRILEQGV